MSALEQCLAAYAAGEVPPRDIEKAAVKETLARLTDAVPGNSVEVRIPPYAAVQIIQGAKHRRGTPPAVVEADAWTWLLLCAGQHTWREASSTGRLRASGERSDLSDTLATLFPPHLP